MKKLLILILAAALLLTACGQMASSGPATQPQSNDMEIMNEAYSNAVSSAFDPSADFSEMAAYAGGNIYVSDVLHKTHIEVGEKGTRAAAITVIEVPRDTAMPPQEEPKTVILDRPFFFMIVDGNENIPLFMGIVNSME